MYFKKIPFSYSIKKVYFKFCHNFCNMPSFIKIDFKLYHLERIEWMDRQTQSGNSEKFLVLLMDPIKSL